MTELPRDHFVYRIWDDEGTLLYVGCSMRPLSRVQAHKRKPWGPDIARVKLYGPYEKYDALDLETAVTEAEHPLYSLSKREVGQIAASASHHIPLPPRCVDVLTRVPHRRAVRMLPAVERAS